MPQFLAQAFDLVRNVVLHALFTIIIEGSRIRELHIYQKATIIYNPAAGRFRRGGHGPLDRAMAVLGRNGIAASLVPTTAPLSAGLLARRAIAEGTELVIAAGGDGTINEVVNGVVHSPVPLAVLPAGTANVLANEMGLSSRLETAAVQLSSCTPRRISVGLLAAGGAERYFLLMAGAGLDAHIVYHVSASLKNLTGKFAYWVAGFSVVGQRLSELRIAMDGRERKCTFALVSKVRNYGGDFEIARDTSLLDDRFEVVLFEGTNPLRYLRYLAAVAFKRAAGVRGVTVLRAQQVALAPSADSRAYVQIDGEFAGNLPCEIRVVPDALTLMIPPEYIRERETAAGAVEMPGR